MAIDYISWGMRREVVSEMVARRRVGYDAQNTRMVIWSWDSNNRGECLFTSKLWPASRR